MKEKSERKNGWWMDEMKKITFEENTALIERKVSLPSLHR